MVAAWMLSLITNPTHGHSQEGKAVVHPASASEVIREGLRLLEEQEEIDRGLDQLDKGQGIPGREARSRLRRSTHK